MTNKPMENDMGIENPDVLMALQKHNSDLMCIKGLFGITFSRYTRKTQQNVASVRYGINY